LNVRRRAICLAAVLFPTWHKFRFLPSDEGRLIARRLKHSSKDSAMPTGHAIPQPADASGTSGDLQAKLFRKIGISAVAAALEAARPARNRKGVSDAVKDLAA
jgi:hypothetical protein